MYTLLLTINKSIYYGSKEFWCPRANEFLECVLIYSLVVADLLFEAS